MGRQKEVIGGLAGLVAGAVAGAKVGAGVGIAMGPLGAMAGTIPGAIVGALIAGLVGNRIGVEIDRRSENKEERSPDVVTEEKPVKSTTRKIVKGVFIPGGKQFLPKIIIWFLEKFSGPLLSSPPLLHDEPISPKDKDKHSGWLV